MCIYIYIYTYAYIYIYIYMYYIHNLIFDRWVQRRKPPPRPKRVADEEAVAMADTLLYEDGEDPQDSKYTPGKPMACKYGLLSVNYGRATWGYRGRFPDIATIPALGSEVCK